MKPMPPNRMRRIACTAILAIGLVLAFAGAGHAADLPAPSLFSIQMPDGDNPAQTSVVLQIFLLLTVLSLAPAILIMLTSFTRMAIVLSVLRQAIGTQSMPPNQVIIGLALFLTFFVMSPVWQKVHQAALTPYLENQISQEEALTRAMAPVREFMFRQTREKDLTMLMEIAKAPRPNGLADVPTTVLIPSFIISEVKAAFQIGLLLYVPFLVVDMVVANVLLSLGMHMLSPTTVSLPFKLLLFVLVDGWYLLAEALVVGYR
jgi:flagellar biosynthetic protein FliP